MVEGVSISPVEPETREEGQSAERQEEGRYSQRRPSTGGIWGSGTPSVECAAASVRRLASRATTSCTSRVAGGTVIGVGVSSYILLASRSEILKRTLFWTNHLRHGFHHRVRCWSQCVHHHLRHFDLPLPHLDLLRLCAFLSRGVQRNQGRPGHHLEPTTNSVAEDREK